jgi:histone H3/H4
VSEYKKHLLANKEWLHHHFITLNMKAYDIAKLAGLKNSNQVHYWAKKYDLSRKPHNIKWTEKEIIKYIKNHQSELKNLTFSEILDKHYQLYRGVNKQIGTLEKAFGMAGVEYNGKKTISKEDLLKLVKNHFTNPETILKGFPYLDQVRYNFGNLDNALKLIGLSNKRELRKEHRKTLVIKDIKKIAKMENQFNSAYVKRKYSKLYYRTYTAFGNWPNGVKAAGCGHKIKEENNE